MVQTIKNLIKEHKRLNAKYEEVCSSLTRTEKRLEKVENEMAVKKYLEEQRGSGELPVTNKPPRMRNGIASNQGVEKESRENDTKT